MVDLTPGSRRKLLRHIDEGRHINELSGLMQISRPAMRKIIEDVIRGTSVTYEDIIGKRRTHDIIPLRHTAIANAVAIRQDLSLPAIGRLFGGRDHTTILHAAQKMGVSNRRFKSNAAQRAA